MQQPRRKLALVVLLTALVAVLPAAADEGMWMPQQIPDLAPRLKELGFTGDAKIWADLTAVAMNAVASLGGCSGSFPAPLSAPWPHDSRPDVPV